MSTPSPLCKNPWNSVSVYRCCSAFTPLIYYRKDIAILVCFSHEFVVCQTGMTKRITKCTCIVTTVTKKCSSCFFSEINLKIDLESRRWKNIGCIFTPYNNHKDWQSRYTTPFHSSNSNLVCALTNPPLTNRGPLQHRQKRVVTHSTLSVSTGSLRLTTGCVCTIKHTSLWRTARLSVTLLIQP